MPVASDMLDAIKQACIWHLFGDQLVCKFNKNVVLSREDGVCVNVQMYFKSYQGGFEIDI